jgi:predicted regulator of Ras-like GTPase activity (Roadblock/LC7/MglB family)
MPQTLSGLDATLAQELQSLRQLCPGVQGVALATGDGLPLWSGGNLQPESACAAAAFLLEQFETHSRLLGQGGVRELLAWTDAGPLYLTRVGELPYVLGVLAGPGPAAPLRHAGALVASRLAPTLSHLNA